MFPYYFHLCNNAGKLSGCDHGTLSQFLLDEAHPQDIGGPIIF